MQEEDAPSLSTIFKQETLHWHLPFIPPPQAAAIADVIIQASRYSAIVPTHMQAGSVGLANVQYSARDPYALA